MLDGFQDGAVGSVEEFTQRTRVALERAGQQCLSYGAPDGQPSVRSDLDFLAEHLA